MFFATFRHTVRCHSLESPCCASRPGTDFSVTGRCSSDPFAHFSPCPPPHQRSVLCIYELNRFLGFFWIPHITVYVVNIKKTLFLINILVKRGKVDSVRQTLRTKETELPRDRAAARCPLSSKTTVLKLSAQSRLRCGPQAWG